MPNPPAAQNRITRLSEKILKHMARLAWSDDRLLQEMKKLNVSAKGSLQTIQRYKNGTAKTSPTPQVIGLISQALGFSDEERDWVVSGEIVPAGVLQYGQGDGSIASGLTLEDVVFVREAVAEKKQLRAAMEHPAAKRPSPMMAPKPPKDFVARPAEFDALKTQLLSTDARGMVAITAALRGAGGYGKTTLARALAYDEDIRRAYSDGVLWVELGEQSGSRVRPIIADLIRLLGGDPRTETPEGARIELATALAGRRTLLVVDDVWERADLEPFLHCGPGTTLLITTRFDKELPDDAVRQAVDAMRDSEAHVLLASGLPQDQVRSQRTELDALARKLHEWAQLLKLANGFLRDRVLKFKQPLVAAIAEAEKRLDSRGLPAFGTPAARGEEGRRKSFAAAMGLNVDLLDAHQRAQLDMLAVFPANVGIPVSIVARLWADGGEPDEYATLDRLTEFFNLSLLLDLDLDRRVIRFHDTTRHYLLDEAKKSGSLAGLHRRLVDAMEGLGTGAPGASSDEDEYYYRHLAEHLADAGLRDRLDALLLDPSWLQDKLAATANPHLLFADYQ